MSNLDIWHTNLAHNDFIKFHCKPPTLLPGHELLESILQTIANTEQPTAACSISTWYENITLCARTTVIGVL